MENVVRYFRRRTPTAPKYTTVSWKSKRVRLRFSEKIGLSYFYCPREKPFENFRKIVAPVVHARQARCAQAHEQSAAACLEDPVAVVDVPARQATTAADHPSWFDGAQDDVVPL